MSQTEFNQEKQVMDKEKENAMQNKKAGKKFGVVMALSCLLGGGLGFFGTLALRFYDMDTLSQMLGENITLFLACVMPILMAVGFVIVFGYAGIALKKSRSEWKQSQDLEDDAYDAWYEKFDRRLTIALNLVSFLIIFNYFGFSACFYGVMYCEGMVHGLFLLGLLMLILTIIFGIRTQGKIVDQVKLVNPEKSGSVYDMKFQKKWIESCDEMEQQMIYRAAFQAYKVTTNVCVALWMVFTILALVIKISLWPVAIVSLIWMILTVTYALECQKLSAGKKKKGEKSANGESAGKSNTTVAGSVTSF